MESVRAYLFGNCRLDRQTLELHVNGQAQSIEPLVFSLLCFLVENHDRFVSKGEILEQVWHGRVVSDSALSSQIKAARKAIGDDGRSQRLIRTIHGKGFRFIGEVRVLRVDANPVSAVGQRAAPPKQNTEPEMEALALPDKPSIAVLPFENMSEDPTQEFFSDGLTEDIISLLSRIRWMFVIARNSTFAYKHQSRNVTQIGRELGVQYVLEGSVRKAGDRIRVNAQLIDAETDSHIWAERYDRKLIDIFDLQDDLSAAIIAETSAELAGSERQKAHRDPSPHLDAWELYQRGMWHFYKHSTEDLAEGQRLFQSAIDRAPEFGNAYAALALIAYSRVLTGQAGDVSETIKEGLRHAEKALECDDRDDLNQFALGRMYMLLGGAYSGRAIAAFRKAIELNPSSVSAYYGLGTALYWAGYAEESISQFTMAIRLSPHDDQLWSFLNMRGWAYNVMGQFESGIADARMAIQQKDDQLWPHLSLAFALFRTGKRAGSEGHFKKAMMLNPNLTKSYISASLGPLHQQYLEMLLETLSALGLPQS